VSSDDERGGRGHDRQMSGGSGGGYPHYGGSGGDFGGGRYGQGAGSYGRRDHPQSVGEANRSMDDSWTTTGDTNRGGSGGRDHFDDHYREWRDRQIAQFDSDYQEYRREQQQQFHSAFDSWRQARRSRQSGTAPEAGAETTAATAETSGGGRGRAKS
jgi:hypothetical protein